MKRRHKRKSPSSHLVAPTKHYSTYKGNNVRLSEQSKVEDNPDLCYLNPRFNFKDALEDINKRLTSQTSFWLSLVKDLRWYTMFAAITSTSMLIPDSTCEIYGEKNHNSSLPKCVKLFLGNHAFGFCVSRIPTFKSDWAFLDSINMKLKIYQIIQVFVIVNRNSY